MKKTVSGRIYLWHLGERHVLFSGMLVLWWQISEETGNGGKAMTGKRWRESDGRKAVADK